MTINKNSPRQRHPDQDGEEQDDEDAEHSTLCNKENCTMCHKWSHDRVARNRTRIHIFVRLKRSGFTQISPEEK
jgi:hypothetical protein